MEAKHKSTEWTAVLRKLGGGSPGSEENLQVADLFAKVRFPATREEVLERLAPGAEFRAGKVAVDLREAVSESKTGTYRTLYDVIDCVKDAMLRAERLETHPA